MNRKEDFDKRWKHFFPSISEQQVLERVYTLAGHISGCNITDNTPSSTLFYLFNCYKRDEMEKKNRDMLGNKFNSGK